MRQPKMDGMFIIPKSCDTGCVENGKGNVKVLGQLPDL